MTLMKSLLLGSAAGIVAVASAQAADLPTRKGPVAAEYVRVCSITVAGTPVVGFVLPGSDTCFKISGYITGQIEGGNLYNGNAVNYTGTPAVAPVFSASGGANTNGNSTTAVVTSPGTAATPGRSTQSILSPATRDSFGFSTRFNLTFDAVSNTAYGPLVAHGEYQFNHAEGFDDLGQGGSDGGLNRAYVTWAGLTAGKIDSFFSFTGGGLGYANFFSPDRKGFNQPDVLAYTASFGGGFAASISIESTGGPTTGAEQATQGGSETGYLGSATQAGHRIPDIVGQLSVHEAWGTAQVSGVGHNVRAISNVNGSTLNKWGYGVDAGVQFNIPNLAGSNIGVTGAYSQNATLYSGLADGLWGDPLQQTNGNGQGIALGDAFSNVDGSWATPTAFSVTGYATFQINPQVNLGAEGSYGQLRWRNLGNGPSLLSNSNLFLVGVVGHYDPVKNLDFEMELLYEDAKTSQPTGYVAVPNSTTQTSSWQGKSDGFAARFQVTRSF